MRLLPKPNAMLQNLFRSKGIKKIMANISNLDNSHYGSANDKHPKKELPLKTIRGLEAKSFYKFLDIINADPNFIFEAEYIEEDRDDYGLGGLNGMGNFNNETIIDVIFTVGKKEGKDVDNFSLFLLTETDFIGTEEEHEIWGNTPDEKLSQDVSDLIKQYKDMFTFAFDKPDITFASHDKESNKYNPKVYFDFNSSEIVQKSNALRDAMQNFADVIYLLEDQRNDIRERMLTHFDL